VACVGDPGKFTYKKSRRGDAEIDRAVQLVLAHSGQDYEMVDFSPYGYDERQYGSPGFNLPVGSLTRTPNGRYPEYHTSADNLDLVRPDCLEHSLAVYLAVIDVLERNRTYASTNPKCEPQLGRRGLYATNWRTGGRTDTPDGAVVGAEYVRWAAFAHRHRRASGPGLYPHRERRRGPVAVGLLRVQPGGIDTGGKS